MYSMVSALLITTTALFQQAAPARWQLSERPLLALGSVEGKIGDLFGSVAGAVRVESGAVMVADGISLEIRLFSASGELLRTAGGRGNGPGEFQTILSARRCSGDFVYVYDPALGRISVFSPKGEYTRTIRVAESIGTNRSPYEFFCNDAGVKAYLQRSDDPPAGIGPRRPDVAITLADDNGFRAELGRFPASERYFDGSNDFPRPLGHVTSIAVGSDIVYVGTGIHVDGTNRTEVSVYSVNGTPLRMLALERQRNSVTRSQVRRFVNDQIEMRRGRVDEASLRRLYSAIEYPSHYPSHGKLLTDPSDNLWVEEYHVPGAARRAWQVYSANGIHIANVHTPPDFRLLEAGDDYVLGVWRGPMNVPFVHVYALVKQPRSR